MNLTYKIFQLKAGPPSLQNYMYIIIDNMTSEAAIVDPGWDLNLIKKFFVKFQVKPSMILLTHSHYDHVNLVDPLVKEYNSSVYMSRVERDFYNFKSENLYSFEDLDVLNLGETPIKCIVTPGHTTGSTCYLLEDALFTGDTVFIEGCGLCDKFGGSPEEMYESFQRLKEIILPHVKVYPGHSYREHPGTSFRDLSRFNIYILIESKEHFVRFRMRRTKVFSGSDLNMLDQFRFYN
ncbi:MBL fold metallo-hydrolase [Halalkalibacter hemicellulosilyticus]|uniref:MBL fold metallo-hydrolase n=1 Tax=Halalkalibacter hemicellulosilyticus TaxID=127886 RepID=UPI003F7242BD